MITVVIATQNDEETLARTLASLVGAAAEGVVREVVVVDGGSRDGTLAVADATGCLILERSAAVGHRLAEGAGAGRRGEWLLFLAPGSVLDSRWESEAAIFIERAMRAGRADQVAAVFRYAVDDIGGAARLREGWTALAGGLFGLPHPAQGLLIKRSHYDRLGRHRPLPALEDVDLARRIGRTRIQRLRASSTRITPAGASGPGLATRLRRRTARALAALALPAGLLARMHGR